MVEAGAKEISEAAILDALDIAHGEIKKLCAAQRELAEKAGKPKVEVEVPQVDESVLAQVKAEFETALTTATQVEDKLKRQDETKAVEEHALQSLSGDEAAEDYKEKRAAVQMAFDKLEKDLIRKRIADRQGAARRPCRRPGARHLDRGRRGPEDARLDRVHPRPDAGLLRGHPGHHARRDAPGHPGPGDHPALLAPLQLPALLGRGGGLHARSQAA